ncbi:aldo/keto reductase [Mycolicibacterium xanthum]|uniref:aldo/keto reductase n=1 Tax=Mycolicibacterium xanthum TaxID=2796469 RepID=UPI0027DF110D|nr:aldo/keto reductase [Mycolicibacterium xanthum]
MILQENYTLSNGLEIPKLGLGTWMIANDAVVQAVKDAIDIGYRHIDTAQAYGNEQGVGAGLRASGVGREDIFVTTKVDAGAKSYQDAAASIDGSLAALGLDHIDLMIIHSPQPWGAFGGDNRYFAENREVWRALEEAYQAGKLKAIGLSNFQKADVDNILETATVRPMVNQILAHISNTPHELITYAQDLGLLVEAYSPVAHGELLKNAEVAALAEKYGVSVPQLSIRYCLQLGTLPLPKTANPDHMRNNADVDFEISGEDMETLKHIDEIKDYGDASVMPVFAKR